MAARKYFDFYPALARATDPGRLDGWELLGAATDRRGTEGPQLRRLDGAWRVLASDGPDNPRGLRERFPVFDLAMAEIGALEAPYPSNIPWPTLLERDGVWTMLTFDGTPYGGGVSGYGTHGDLVVMRTGAPDRGGGSNDRPGQPRRRGHHGRHRPAGGAQRRRRTYRGRAGGRVPCVRGRRRRLASRCSPAPAARSAPAPTWPPSAPTAATGSPRTATARWGRPGCG